MIFSKVGVTEAQFFKKICYFERFYTVEKPDKSINIQNPSIAYAQFEMISYFPPTWVFCCVVTVEETQLDIHSGFGEAGGADALFISCTVLRYQVRAMYFWSWPGCFCVLYRLAMLLKSTSGSLSRFLSILGSWEMSFTNFSHWRRAPSFRSTQIPCWFDRTGLRIL